MTSLRIVTLSGDPEHEAMLAGLLDQRHDVELVLRCVDRVELLGAIRGGGLDAIVSVGAPQWLDRQSADEASAAGIRIVAVVGDAEDGERVAALGADLVAPHAPIEQILQRCERGVQSPAAPLPSTQPSRPVGKLIAVWGPKGAPGRSRIALELAAELSVDEHSTMLIDADPYGGDLLQMLGVVEELPTIVWAARMAAKEELDAARLALDLRRAGRSGPVFLPGLARAELWPEVADFGWRQLLKVAQASFRFTVCDTGFCLEPDASPYPGNGEGRNRLTRSTLREAQQVVAVCRGDPIGLKTFLWAFDDMQAVIGDTDVVIVANRAPQPDQREIGDILRKHLGRRPIAYIPECPNDVARAVREGRAVRELKPGSDMTLAIRAAASVMGARLRSTGFLSKLAGRR